MIRKNIIRKLQYNLLTPNFLNKHIKQCEQIICLLQKLRKNTQSEIKKIGHINLTENEQIKIYAKLMSHELTSVDNLEIKNIIHNQSQIYELKQNIRKNRQEIKQYTQQNKKIVKGYKLHFGDQNYYNYFVELSKQYDLQMKQYVEKLDKINKYQVQFNALDQQFQQLELKQNQYHNQTSQFNNYTKLIAQNSQTKYLYINKKKYLKELKNKILNQQQKYINNLKQKDNELQQTKTNIIQCDAYLKQIQPAINDQIAIIGHLQIQIENIKKLQIEHFLTNPRKSNQPNKWKLKRQHLKKSQFNPNTQLQRAVNNANNDQLLRKAIKQASNVKNAYDEKIVRNKKIQNINNKKFREYEILKYIQNKRQEIQQRQKKKQQFFERAQQKINKPNQFPEIRKNSNRTRYNYSNGQKIKNKYQNQYAVSQQYNRSIPILKIPKKRQRFKSQAHNQYTDTSFKNDTTYIQESAYDQKQQLKQSELLKIIQQNNRQKQPNRSRQIQNYTNSENLNQHYKVRYTVKGKPYEVESNSRQNDSEDINIGLKIEQGNKKKQNNKSNSSFNSQQYEKLIKQIKEFDSSQAQREDSVE